MSKSSHSDTLDSSADQPVTLGEILSALSFALDVTEGARPGHSIRACLLGMRLGKQIGLPDQALANLYYALLLKDIGCSSNSARMAGAFAADDQMVKQHFKFIDREKLGKPNREALSFVWENVAPTANAWNRIRQIYRMVRSPGDLTAEMIEARCERGAVILHKLGMGIETCAAVYSLDEQWNGHGLPDHLVARDIPLLGRICAVAQHLDFFCGEFGPARAMDTLAERSGSWYDPDLVRAAESLHRQKALWAQCLPDSDSEALRLTVLALDPGSSAALAARDIDLICSGFADVVDAKSPFMYRHSVATTEAAVLISKAMGLAPDRVDVLFVAPPCSTTLECSGFPTPFSTNRGRSPVRNGRRFTVIRFSARRYSPAFRRSARSPSWQDSITRSLTAAVILFALSATNSQLSHAS